MSDTTELTVIERAAVALGADKHEQELLALSKQYTDIVEIKNNAGRDQCHAAAMVLSKAITHTDKTGKEAREDANAFQKAVIVEAKRRIAIVEPERDRLIGLRDAWDEARAAEKAAIAAREKARVDSIRARIEAFMLDAVTASSGTAAEIDEHATRLSETVIDLEGWQEFTEEAQVKRDDTVKWLRERQQDAANREAEALRLAEERAQLAKEREEAAERERLAEQKRQRFAEEQREAQEKAAAAMRAEREAHERRLAAESEAANAAYLAQREAEQASLRAQQEAADKLNAAMSEIQGIQHQVIIAQSGRLGVRKGGTIECLRETLAETEAWEIDDRFGILRGAAESAKTTAVAEIRRLLAEAEARVVAEVEAARIAHAEAERIFVEEEQRRQQAAAEAARIQAEKDAAEAERQRRERVQFELNGPGESEIIRVLAEQFKVTPEVALAWIATFDMAYNDHMEKAA